MILAGDVGGTKVSLALFDVHGEIPTLEVERSYASRDYPDFIPILQHFLQETRPTLTHACLGVAGAVHDGRCKVTHLPWRLDVQELKSLLRVDSVTLINDLAALAHSIPHLPPGELEVIQEGAWDASGPIGILSAGTGLGQAILLPEAEGRFRVLETEGGQCDFPARTEQEVAILETFRQELGRVGIEDVLSGPGLVRLYRFFKDRIKEPEPEWLIAEFQKQNPASVISDNGLRKKFKACEHALEVLVSVYGAVAGNLALQVMARGGIYLGGGIAPEILPLLKTNRFLDAFHDKGTFQSFMAQVPIKVVVNKGAPLLGAAYFALGEKPIQ